MDLYSYPMIGTYSYPMIGTFHTYLWYALYELLPEISPNPLPTKIILKLKFFEVVSVDETKCTVTLSFKTMVDWQDHRLDVNRSSDSIQK